VQLEDGDGDAKEDDGPADLNTRQSAMSACVFWGRSRASLEPTMNMSQTRNRV
jgi:hypothetical protein